MVARGCGDRETDQERGGEGETNRQGALEGARPWERGEIKVTQSLPTLCNPMDCIVHGILQAKILKWVAFLFSRGSSPPRDQTQVSRFAGRFFTS